jgi:hypothetical protein
MLVQLSRKQTARLCPTKSRSNMRKPWHPSTSVLLMLSAALLASCASAPQVPVVAQCPKLADPPPSLMQSPQATNSLTELETLLRNWLGDAKQTLVP